MLRATNVVISKNVRLMQKEQTWLSYGRKAMLISFKVLIFRAAQDLHNSLNNSSGQTGSRTEQVEICQVRQLQAVDIG